MKYQPKSVLVTVLLALIALCGVKTTCACEIPVYQYAIEHWESSPYALAVYHRGLSDFERVQIENYQKQLKSGELNSNVEIHLVDVREPMEELIAQIWERDMTDSLPMMCLYYPGITRISSKLWEGQITEENFMSISDSSKRKEIANSILSGDSIVWVFLESGDGPRDELARETLAKTLNEYAKVFDGSSEVTEASLWIEQLNPQFVKNVKFDTVTVSRSDPEEQVLIEQLLGSEPGLKDLSEPMIFPVFGRGRLLYALVGKGITQYNIKESLQFVLGPCSCIVKDDNPGVDLLQNVDWELELEDMVSPNVQPVQLSSVSGILEAASSSLKADTDEFIEAGVAASQPTVPFRLLTLMVIAVIIFLLIIVATLTKILFNRMNS